MGSHEGARALKGRDFLTLFDFSRTEIEYLLERAAALKAERLQGIQRTSLAGKHVGLLFFKPSTRTRISFEVAARELGGSALYLSASELQLGRGESVEDTARVLSRYLHALVIRTFAHEELEAFAASASIPVINGLTDSFHPVQVLADLLTVKERFGELRGVRLAYVGDGNNMAHSLMAGGALLGMDVVVSSPRQYQPDPAIVRRAQEVAARSGGSVTWVPEPAEAVRGARVVYTDTWVSMGQEEERSERLAAFQGFQVNEELLGLAAPDAVFLHCLPAHKGEEVSGAVFESDRSLVFEQAENRLHAQKALLESLLG